MRAEMFDIGFAELILISVVGLLVLGPERLPGAIRTVSFWLGRLRRSFNTMRAEIEREINADEIRQDLYNESLMKTLSEAEADPRRDPEAPASAEPEAGAPASAEPEAGEPAGDAGRPEPDAERP